MQIRIVLRAAGCSEFPAGARFAVESGDPFLVPVCDGVADPARPGLARPGDLRQPR